MGSNVGKLFLSGTENEKNAIGGNLRKRMKRGHPPEDDLCLSEYSFVYQKVCKDYLRCDITPLTKTKQSGKVDLVSLERLPTDFLDSDYPGPDGRRQFRQYFEVVGEKFRRVVGLRELLMKREYAEYLEETNNECSKVSKRGYPVQHYWKLARGGGPKKATTGTSKKVAKKETKKGHESEAKKVSEKGDKDNKAGSLKKKSGESKKVKQKKSVDGGGGGCFGKCFGGNSHSLTTKEKESREKAKKNTELQLKHKVVKKWKWPNKRRRLPKPEPANKFVVLQHRLYRLPRENEERDNEWLYLSSSTEENDPDVVSHFDKQFHRWMTPGISFESQKLFRQLALFWSLVTFSGRSFLHHRNNYLRGHVEFSCKKRQMITFFLTTILFWTILCMSICSYMDINANLNVHQSRDRFLLVEKLELRKYWLPYAVLIANLVLVAFWSLAVILGDGNLIAHYMNCWCAALHEMETSGALDIRKLTLRNMQVFAMLAAAYTVMFIFKWPGPIRGSCMLTSMLLLRPSIPLLRISQPARLVIFEWIGLGIQLYVLFCARMVMCFLQIFALMLKNVSEMWNFKFSLRFRLLAQENRGELVQLQLNHSLAKLWSHHRLIVILLEQYGLVFSIGIMCYIIPQVCIFAVVLASLILNDDASDRQFYGNQKTVLIYSDNITNLNTIEIPYYHTAMENNITAAVIFLHILQDFFFTTDMLTSATDAFLTGAEFVRRVGLFLTAQKSHERRLIYSLQWSFSPTRLNALTANRYFTLDRHCLTKLFSLAVLIFTIFLRTSTPSPPIKITFPLRGSCSKPLGQTLVHGICTIGGGEIADTTPLPLPPAVYYFFMEHCKPIEKNLSNFKLNMSFGYFEDESTGKKRVANKPPFQICRLETPEGAPLPEELKKLGRYFQDHGNARLNKTLHIYFKQTYDYSTLNYTELQPATFISHPDSTGGTYCGPDSKGHPGQSCEWVEYYRDCVVLCYSKYLRKAMLLPKILKKATTGLYELYTDYHEVDCGINPFGWRMKGDSFSMEDPAYDCFGNRINMEDFDICSNFAWSQPVAPFTPAQGDMSILQRDYTSKWDKTLAPVCGKCYDHDVGKIRCANSALVKAHCPYSRYWGKRSPKKGFYFAENCWQLKLTDKPKPTGFCTWDYVEGGVLAGHVVSKATYDAARSLHWKKEWNISKGGEKPPCQNPEKLRPIEEQLYYKHVCLSNKSSSEPSCGIGTPPTGSFFAHRPYELKCSKLRQIQLNYEVHRGNSDICNLNETRMIVPTLAPITLKITGKLQKYPAFYGCNGKMLLPTNHKGYRCIGPEIGGVCEVDAAQGYFLFEDCMDPEVSKSSSAAVRVTQDSLELSLPYGFCFAVVDNANPTFANFKRKLLSEELVRMLRLAKEWNSKDVWNVAQKILMKPPDVQNKASYCEKRLTDNYCGINSVALHYPYDGRDSVQEKDKFLCDWEVYYRDCIQPFPSRLVDGWVYLPKTLEPSTIKLSTNLRKNYPLVNSFWWNKYLLSCDGRTFPSSPGGPSETVDNYWIDDCGWIMTPEFVDGDIKSLAVMPPIVPIGREFYTSDGQRTEHRVLYCFDSEYAIYRCTHADIFPICKSKLSIWEPTHGEVDACYRFNGTCYEPFNKQPNGSLPDVNISLAYPNGFCKGFCPQQELKDELIISEKLMNAWRNIDNLEFIDPPCSNYSGSGIPFVNSSVPLELEHHLFFEFHCGDPSNNGKLRDPTDVVTSTFHWPMYQDENTLKYKFLPVRTLLNHLTTTFGPACNYGGRDNEGKLYPLFVEIPDPVNSTITQKLDQTDYLGCHGFPMVWLLEEFRQNVEEMATIGVLDPLLDYRKICLGELLGGWCEASVEPLVFLRQEFEVTCRPDITDLTPAKCPSKCTDMEGHFANTSLSQQLRDIPGYSAFVRTRKKHVVAKNIRGTAPMHILSRTDLPFRRLFLSEFREVSKFWRLYKNPDRQREYLEVFRRQRQFPRHRRCYQFGHLHLMQEHCTWPMFLKWCTIPCNLVSSPKIITEVSQSLVDVTPGLPDMYLRHLPFLANPKNYQAEPIFSFVDCIIDPMTAIRNHSSTDVYDSLFTCAGIRIDGDDWVDRYKYIKFPEFLPDYQKAVVDPTTGARWVPWVITYPEKVRFEYQRLKDYYNPTIADIANPPKVNHTVYVFASPYLACHRMTQEPMRNAVLTADLLYWNKKYMKFGVNLQATSDYSYDPESNMPERKMCTETAVSVYVDHHACRHYSIPSKVMKIYGFCKAILPAIRAHTAWSALAEDVAGKPPRGCTNNQTHPLLFNKTFADRNEHIGLTGFGIPYTVLDVYKQWNSLCHACAYTREQHADNIKSSWCGKGKDADLDCQSHVESKHPNRRPVSYGDGTFYKQWLWAVGKVGVLWLFATQYACWNGTGWGRHARWTTYHPWSQVHETKAAAYNIHVPMNALDCPFPCRSQDESEDCNSRCPHRLHNPCLREPGDFFSYESPKGLKYTMFLREDAAICKVPLPGLNEKLQGLQVFGEYGSNLVYSDTRHKDRNEAGIFLASSEYVLRDDWRDGTATEHPFTSGLWFYYLKNYHDNMVIYHGVLPEAAWELPRLAAVHPAWYKDTPENMPMYSSYCAGLEGDTCEVYDIRWNTNVSVPGGISVPRYLMVKEPEINPFPFLTVEFSSGCTVKDRQLINGLLDQDPKKPYVTSYCCIPYQTLRRYYNIFPEEWERRYFLTLRGTWKQCEDLVDHQGKSRFGWFFRWDKWARYLSACPISNCRNNQCQYQLRNYTPNSDSDLCTRQFDPQEKFLKEQIHTCKLPLPPF